MNYELIIQGIDVSAYAVGMPELPSRKNAVGELVELPNLTLELDNTDNVFTPYHPNSILGTGWNGMDVLIYDSPTLIYQGIVRNVDVSQDGTRARLMTTSRVNEILNAALPLTSYDAMPIAQLSKALYELYGIPCDPATYNQAIRYHTEHNLVVDANVQTGDTTLLQAQQWLAKAGLARHYFVGDTAFFEVQEANMDAYPSLVTLTNADLLEVSAFSLLETEMFNGYEVLTKAGTAFLAGSKMAPTLDGSFSSMFRIPSAATGYSWGPLFLALSQRERYRLTGQISSDGVGAWINKHSLLTIDSAQVGITMRFEIVALDWSDPLGPKVELESI